MSVHEGCPVYRAGEDWSTFRYNEPSLSQDPRPVYDALLEARVVHSDELGGYWVLSRYEDVFYAYQHPEIFSSYPNSIPAPEGSGGGIGAIGKLIPLEIDPPDHAGYRRILASPFGPGEIRKYEGWVRQRSHELLDAVLANGECEFMADFATPLPTEMWCKLMGVATGDAVEALRWANTMMHGDPTASDGGQALRQQAGLEAYAYLWPLLEDRRTNPGQDLISYLLASKFDHERDLTDAEVLNTSLFILLAGLDTTRGVLGDMIWFLATNPDHRSRIANDPAVIPSAVEELLRRSSPITPGRTLLNDTVIGGKSMKKGDHVLLVTGAVGRDPRQFEDPDHIDFDRQSNRHLAFGVGAHRCAGSHLARMELQIALEVIHQRMPDYHLIPDAPVVWQPIPLRGLEELHLAVGA